MGQFIAHLFGDFILQSHWMACEKHSKTFPALAHAIFYGLPFLFLTRSALAIFVIVVSHFIIDRWHLSRFIIWVKNFISPRAYWYAWNDCQPTGYPSSESIWLTKWLDVAADNAFHLLINYLSITHL